MVVAIETSVLSMMAAQRSSYLKYLPPIYSDSDFMGRFLMIFESIMGPVEGIVDSIAYYFDPHTTPEELLPWLSSWVNIVLDERWPAERRRRIVKSAVQLYRRRGTRRGLRDYLNAYVGVEPEIVENYGGLSLSGNAVLGWNTVLGSSSHHTFSVTLRVEDPAALNVEHLKSIIESEKPAHTAYELNIIRAE